MINFRNELFVKLPFTELFTAAQEIAFNFVSIYYILLSLVDTLGHFDPDLFCGFYIL